MSITKRPKTPRLSLEEVADKIKRLVSRSALAKIEIGELLAEYTSEIEHGEKADFYKSIGMEDRTAQHYMKIARDPEVQKLKRENKLEGMNMTAILAKAGLRLTNRNKDVKKPEPGRVSIEVFKGQFEKCKSTKVLKIQYALLSNKVSELEAELAELRPVIKRA